MHYTVLHCPAMHCSAVHCTALHCSALQCTVLHCTELQMADAPGKWLLVKESLQSLGEAVKVIVTILH